MIGDRQGSFGAQAMNGFRRCLQSLFALSAHECAYCRKPVKSVANPLRLCDACFRTIPWIREVLCPVCGRYEACTDCTRRKETYFVMNRSAVRYDEFMKEWLAKFKYRGDERLRQLIGSMLMQGYHHYMKLPDVKARGFDAVTFVPLSESRLEERGFNQAEQLARIIGGRTNLPVVPMLVRIKHTAKQSFKTRSERLSDMSGVFAFDPAAAERLNRIGSHRRPLHFLIIDDVYTTGSTLNQCAHTITEAMDAKVFGLTWAR